MRARSLSSLPARQGRLVKRSFSLAGHRTSVALEGEFWAALAAIAVARELTVSALVQATDAAREPGQPLASALRLLALRAVMRCTRATDR